jgi:hypothetical protein
VLRDTTETRGCAYGLRFVPRSSVYIKTLALRTNV